MGGTLVPFAVSALLCKTIILKIKQTVSMEDFINLSTD